MWIVCLADNSHEMSIFIFTENQKTTFQNTIRYISEWCFNPSPAEPGYALPLQTVQIQINWLLKTTDLDLHCLSLSMWICINNLDQEIWLADN